MQWQLNNKVGILEKELELLDFEFSDDDNIGIEFFLRCLEHVFMKSSKQFYSFLLDKGYALSELSDVKFVEIVLVIVVKEFSLKPNLSLKQFFNSGFMLQKIEFCIKCARAVRGWAKENEVKVTPKLTKKRLIMNREVEEEIKEPVFVKEIANKEPIIVKGVERVNKPIKKENKDQIALLTNLVLEMGRVS